MNKRKKPKVEDKTSSELAECLEKLSEWESLKGANPILRESARRLRYLSQIQMAKVQQALLDMAKEQWG